MICRKYRESYKLGVYDNKEKYISGLIDSMQTTIDTFNKEVLKCGKADRIHIPEDGEIIDL